MFSDRDDSGASAQYRLMDKLYIKGGLDAMRKEYYRVSAGTEGPNSIYARAAYNALCTREKQEQLIKEETIRVTDERYIREGIEGLKHLVNYYRDNGYFDYASVSQNILSAKEKEEAMHTSGVTKGANHYYETGGMGSLKHLVKYYEDNNYSVHANIAKKILKQKEEWEPENIKKVVNDVIQEDERVLEPYDVDESIEGGLVKLESSVSKRTGSSNDDKQEYEARISFLKNILREIKSLEMLLYNHPISDICYPNEVLSLVVENEDSYSSLKKHLLEAKSKLEREEGVLNAKEMSNSLGLEELGAYIQGLIDGNVHPEAILVANNNYLRKLKEQHHRQNLAIEKDELSEPKVRPSIRAFEEKTDSLKYSSSQESLKNQKNAPLLSGSSDKSDISPTTQLFIQINHSGCVRPFNEPQHLHQDNGSDLIEPKPRNSRLLKKGAGDKVLSVLNADNHTTEIPKGMLNGYQSYVQKNKTKTTINEHLYDQFFEKNQQENDRKGKHDDDGVCSKCLIF